MNRKNKKIIVGMSGGIDSSMAAYLLKKQSWNPVGISLKMPVWKGKKDFSLAKKVCEQLKIPHQIIDVEKDFQKKVINHFLKELKQGKTPNPCIICNPQLKFKKLLETAKKQGIKYVATGHYARIKRLQDYPPAEAQHVRAGKITRLQEFQLLKARDKTKDQTYNLCFLTQKQLKHIIFPLGNEAKKQVYKLAKKQGFSYLIKQRESQDFCYCPSKKIPNLLKEKIGKRPGKIVDEKGKILGKHQGLHFYTIGQRKRIKLSGGPYFVKAFDKKKNELVVTKNEKSLLQKEVILSPFNFISGQKLTKKIKVMAKIRYQQPEKRAILYPQEGNKLKLVFEKPQRAITPGQFAVFYLPTASQLGQAGQVCLGGGKII